MISTPIKRALIAAFAAIICFSAHGQTTSLVSIDGNGHLTYTPDEKGNVLPDFSFVGYHHGEKPIPDVAVAKTISPLAGDNRYHIQNAIDEVALLPADANGHRGAVLLSAGLYEVEGTIFMKSGVVLRGMGDATRIVAVFPTRDPIISVNSGSSPGHSRRETTKKKITDSYVPFGARTFTIESGHTFQTGDRVVIQRVPTETWVDLIGTDNVAPDGAWTASGYSIDFLRVIEAVDGNSITVDAPVVDHMYSGIADGYLYKYDDSPDLKTEIGIEDLRLESSYSDEYELSNSNSGININVSENGWVRNVDAYHFTGNAVTVNSGAYKWTIDNCRYFRPVGNLYSGTRYSFSINTNAHQILIQNCFSDFGRHDFATGSRVPGPSVFSNCKAMNCWNVSGPHHRWATGILYDNVDTDLDLNVENRTDSGSGHGYAGANHVMWNCSTYSRMVIHDPPTDANNWAIGCIAGEGVTGVGRKSTEDLGLVESEGVHIEDIPILYRAQLDDRLGAGTASTGNPFPGFTGDQTIYPDELTIVSATAGNEAEHHGITRLAEHSFDNDLQTRWASSRDDSNTANAWIEYTLDGTYKLYRIRLQLFNSWIRTYPLKIEIDGATVFTGTSQLTEEMGWNEFAFSPVAGSKVKISLTAKNSFNYVELCMHETKIYGANDVSSYNLTVNSGSGDGTYVDGSVVVITADEAPGEKAFDQWAGDVSSVDDVHSETTNLTMPASDIQVTATYQNTYNLTVSSGTGDGRYIEGEQVVISADEAPTGQLFDQWNGNVGKVEDIFSPITWVTMPATDIDINATYQVPSKLTPVADAYVRGGLNSINNFGSETEIIVKERPGELKEHYEGFIKFDLSALTETVTGAKLRIYVSSNPGGSNHNCAFVGDDSWTENGITYSNKPGTGTILDTKVVPGAGNWIEFDVTEKVNTEIVGDGIISFQITDDIQNIAVTYHSKEGANPPELIYALTGGSDNVAITATAGSNGSISPVGNLTYTVGLDQSFYIWADDGFEIEDVLVDGESVGAVSVYTFSDLTADHTITVSFMPETHTITASTGSNGSITPSGNVQVPDGTDQTFDIDVNPGFTIEDVFYDGSSIGPVSSFTFSNVTADHTISASFVPISSGCDPVTIQAESGSIGGECSIANNHGGYEGAGFVAFPADGGFVELNAGGCSGGNYILTYRYALETGSATGALIINGESQDISLTETGNWSYWNTADVPVTLNSGTSNTIRFESTGQGFGSVDQILLTPDTSAVSAPSIENTGKESSLIRIFPNPTNRHITIVGIDGKANVRIYDLLGKELMNRQVNSNIALDISQLNAGMYLIEVREKGKWYTERLIKQ